MIYINIDEENEVDRQVAVDLKAYMKCTSGRAI
jgi:hypothetical protein